MTKFLNLLKKQKRTLLLSLAVAGLAIVMAFGIQLVFAWTEPELEPPYGNVGAPINTGSDYQKKTGDLGVNFLYGDDIRLGNWTQNPISSGGNIVLHNSAGTQTIDINGDTGELTVSTKITSPQYCIAANCITSWPAAGVTCPDCDSRFVNVTGDTMTGNLTVSTQITSPKYCINGNCIASWTDAGGLTCATCDAGGNLKIDTDKKLILEANDGEIYRAGGNVFFQADDQWNWYSSWSMQNEMVLNYNTGLTLKGNLTLQSDTKSDPDETGKLTAPGGVDPPYVSFSAETHESIREFAKKVEGHEKVMQFFNGETHRLEIYVINEDKFYTITGEPVE